MVYDPRSKTLRVSADVVCDETFASLGHAEHFAFRDAVPVFTADTWQSDPTKFISSVPADDHYGPPQTTYHEDYPSDGFLISSQHDPSFELFSTADDDDVINAYDVLDPPTVEEEFIQENYEF